MATPDRSRLPVFGALRRQLRTSRAWTLCLLLFAIPLLGVAASKEARYPYDPACPWGRLANGKGMLNRCLTENEAVSLATTGTTSEKCPPSAPTEGVEAAPSEQLPEPSAGPIPFDLVVGPIQADQGDITVGKLGVPVERYRQCVEEGGGLTKPQAKVVVKFLVRGERVRAEGASVETFDGVSEKTARCIADVVDRRQVGAPSVPLTGAHLTFQLSEKTPR